MTDTVPYTLIETEAGLQQFVSENQNIDWIGFDTEFIGEKRFYTKLCLIQIATANGNYLFDVIKLDNFQPLLDMISDPAILIITHAGENDYRILNVNYNVIPKNVFDTQVAAGFLGFRYPVSFRKLVEKECRVHLNKGYTVTDWEARPLKQRQLSYALNDVIYLKELYEKLHSRLVKYKRLEWVEEEFSLWESPKYYDVNIYKEALESKLIKKLDIHERVFLIRLYQWRIEEAKKRDYSKEMVLPTKYMSVIIKNIKMGKTALLDNRILSNKMIERHWKTFNSLYQKKIEPFERELISIIPPEIQENPAEELTSELLYILLKKQCLDNNVAPSLVISKNHLKRLRNDPNYDRSVLQKGWKTALLSEDLIDWIMQDGNLKMTMADGKCTIMKKE